MAKPCGFAIEFNPLGTPPLSLYSSTRDGAPHAGVDDGVAGAARCAWTGGRSGGVAHRASAGWAAVLRPVPSPRQTTTVLWGGEGGPSAGALVQAAVRPGAVLRRLRARRGEKPTRLRENAWKFRGSSFPCQGNKHRLTGKTSEAVFVSFVWVN